MGELTTTVYIIGYDGDRWLPDCIATLRQASIGQLALVLIDNYRNPCLAELDLSGFDLRVVTTPHRMGFADAHNFGIVAAPPATATTVLLNQDTLSRPGWLDDCVACFYQDPQLGVLSPSIRTYDWQGWDPAFRVCASVSSAFEPQQVAGEEGTSAYQVPVVTGAAMMVHTEAMLAHGLFDPIFGSYYEDYDFCRRLARHGWHAAICPSAVIGHYSGSATTTPAAERRRLRLIQRNRIIERMRLAGSHRKSAFLKQVTTGLPHQLVRGLMRTASSQPVATTLGAYWDFVKVIPRLLNAQRDEAAFERHLTSIHWRSIPNPSLGQ